MTSIDTPTTVWGIHNDLPIFDFVERGSIAIGWSGLGDIGQIRSDRAALKAALSDVYPHKGLRTFATWAGVLARFAGDIQIGDVVVHPHRPDSTVAIGVVIGDYEFSESVSELAP